jgi:hypothetical protein
MEILCSGLVNFRAVHLGFTKHFGSALLLAFLPLGEWFSAI